ncbi:MAG: hypothetical protein ACREJB_11105 [Planctomycetaceae bacterium]
MPTPRFHVLLTDRAWPDFELERAVLAEAGAAILESPAADERTLCGLATDADALAGRRPAHVVNPEVYA